MIMNVPPIMTRPTALLLSRSFTSLVRFVEKMVPPVRAWHRFAYERHFAALSSSNRLYRGVYGSFTEAIQAAPKTHEIGYNHPKSGELYLDLIGHVWPSDYPVLLWLQSLLPTSSRLFDLGGNIGLHFYTFQRYLQYPTGFEWQICDLPEITAAGVKVAAQRTSNGLRFTNDVSDASGADILLASGTLQYIENPFSTVLSRLQHKPKHLLVNKLPLSSWKTFVTLQNIGPVICPYYIFNKTEFIDSVCMLGYEVTDTWTNPEFNCYIPYHPERFLDSFTGFHFILQG
jgi:putative methyltransferase (TIGR04325 family)